MKVALQSIKLYPAESAAVKSSVSALDGAEFRSAHFSTVTISDAGRYSDNGQKANQKDLERFMAPIIQR